jgi:hypothetical protein
VLAEEVVQLVAAGGGLSDQVLGQSLIELQIWADSRSHRQPP